MHISLSVDMSLRRSHTAPLRLSNGALRVAALHVRGGHGDDGVCTRVGVHG